MIVADFLKENHFTLSVVYLERAEVPDRTLTG